MQYVTGTRDWRYLIDPERGLYPYTVISKAVERPAIPFDNELHEILGQLDTIKGEVVHEALSGGRKLSAGPQWGLYDFSVSSDGILELLFKPVTYYDNLVDWGLARRPQLKKRVMDVSEKKLGDPYALHARVLAANATLQLLKEGSELSYKDEIENGEILHSDAYGPILLNFRDWTQFEYWLTFHNSGGHPKKGDKGDNEIVHNWHYVMKSQLVKEYGIDMNSIVDLRLIGLAENVHTNKPDLLYFALVNETPSQVLKRKGEESDEFLSLVILENLDELYELVERNQEKGKFYFPKSPSRTFYSTLSSTIKERGLDPNTSNNFCPVGEACLASVLQDHGYDLSKVYEKAKVAV